MMSLPTRRNTPRNEYQDCSRAASSCLDCTTSRSTLMQSPVDDVATPSKCGSLKPRNSDFSVSGKFKAVSQLIVAINRLKASLNPTYTYGKRLSSTDLSESPDSNSFVPEVKECTASQRIPNTRGHKTDYLMRSLPPAPGEVNNCK